MHLLRVAVLIGLMAAPAAAQPVPPVHGGRAGSLGQPGMLQWTGAFWLGREGGPHAASAFGLQRDLLNPVLSLLAVHGELYLRSGGDDVVPGVRARVLSPVARIGIGADYRPGEGTPDVVLSMFHPVRRGGLFADGSVLRFDYVPARDHGFVIGVEKPLLRKTRIGRSRPARDHARLPAPRHAVLPPITGRPLWATTEGASAAQLELLADAARAIRLTTLPLGPVPRRGATDTRATAAGIAPVKSALAAAALPYAGGASADGGGAEAAVRRWHDGLERAFAAAAAGGGAAPDDAPALGATAAAAARSILLDEVLLPYNRLLGQSKRPDGLHGLGAAAFGVFDRWLHLQPGVPAAARPAMQHVFATLVSILDANRAALLADWRDSRFVWLPLQYALRPEDHDTQQKLDAIIERATGERFTDGNFVSWVVNEQFQYQLSRTIRAASEYHVLWTHDFRGFDAGGEPDEMSYRHVLHSYLAAMTERVRAYDRTGEFPAYLIIMDQFFYEVNRGRLWMSLLEDPLGHRLVLPPTHAAWQDSIAAAQRELRNAVASSPLLQAQAALHGEHWLRDLIRVNVNITNPADPSFWSTTVMRRVPLPDNMMRDHRKVAFYDISEADPYAGEALFTGAGVGEHYANLSWEDRSVLVRGPVLLPLKQAARELLIEQGLPRPLVPHALLPRPLAADYDARVRAAAQRSQQPLRALQAHNGAGFDDKHVNVLKAVLYTLMPAGSTAKIPDSLWNSDFWGSLLLGCALRGGRVVLIAPAASNAPSADFGTIGRSGEMLGRLVTARNELAPEIAAAGGLLAIGIYETELQVTDIPEKVRLVNTAFTAHDWLRRFFGFPPSVLDELAMIATEIEGLSMAPDPFDDFEHDPQPKLHLKANFFASPEAWTLMQRAEWAAAAWAYMQIRVNQVQTRSAAVRSFAEYPEAIADVGGGMVRDWYGALDDEARDRVIFYTLIGSHNQNARSIVIDAEVGLLIAEWPAIIPYIDLITLMGQTRWIDTADQLAPLLPLDTGWRRRLAFWARLAL
jgi:hypothetical protein